MTEKEVIKLVRLAVLEAVLPNDHMIFDKLLGSIVRHRANSMLKQFEIILPEGQSFTVCVRENEEGGLR